MQIKNIFMTALLVCSIALTVKAAEAQVDITYNSETPGAETTNVVGATTETFTGFAAGDYSTLNTAVGTLTAGKTSYNQPGQIAIVNADQYGGAGGTGEYSAIGVEAGSDDAESATLTFSQPESYVGMWWSACDPGNILSLYDGTTLLATLDESSLSASINSHSDPSAYYGNPSDYGADNGEIFAYLNFYALNGADITSAVITEDQSIDNAGFEFDNVSVATNYSNPGITGTSLPNSAVPEPSQNVLMLIAASGLCSLMLIKRRQASGLI